MSRSETDLLIDYISFDLIVRLLNPFVRSQLLFRNRYMSKVFPYLPGLLVTVQRLAGHEKTDGVD